MNRPYVDFHTHTIRSDGAYTPLQLCEAAHAAGIGVLAVTDHNYTESLSTLRTAFPDMQFVQGAEVSCLYTDDSGKEQELHVVALGIDPNNAKLQAVLAHNQPDRQPYVDAILDKLRLCGVDLGDYALLRELYPEKGHLGRMDIAKTMTDRGYVSSIDEAFDVYLGAHGERRAFVPNPLRYVSLEEAVDAILDAGGIAVLAHLYYYILDDECTAALLRRFKELTGNRGGMEVYYARYDSAQRKALKALADEYDLMYSAASDFHGQNPHEPLANGFARDDCAALLAALGIQ